MLPLIGGQQYVVVSKVVVDAKFRRVLHSVSSHNSKAIRDDALVVESS
jgi:hypothetical protein